MESHNKKVWKFCHTMQDMVKCPDCDNTFTEPIFMCSSGHSICRNCHSKRIGCIKCHAPYTSMRNVLVENLLSQFTDLKGCLGESNGAKIQPEKVPRLPTLPIVKLPPRHYRCWITTECEFTGCLASVIQHLNSSAHAKRYFKEHAVGKMPFEKYWDMFYSVGTNYNRAIRIPEIGLFTLYIWENVDNQLKACIFMCARNSVASQYSYTIQIGCGERKQSFTSRVESARISKQIVHGSNFECLTLHPNDRIYIAMREQSRFKCSIVIKQNTIVNNDNGIQCNQMASINTPSKKKKRKKKSRNRRPNTYKVVSVHEMKKMKKLFSACLS